MGASKIMIEGNTKMEWEEVGKKISGAKRILISTHENPDGDGLGSELAMAQYLKRSSVDFKIINTSPLPQEYLFLDKDGLFETYNKEDHSAWIKSADLAIIFDVGNFVRCRKVFEEITENNIDTINIDHHPHPENHPFTLNIVDLNAAATGCMVFDFLKHNMSVPLNKQMLIGIYTAVMTDTGCFRHSNTDEKCHLIAIETLNVGVDTNAIYQRVYENSTKTRIALLGRILTDIHYELDGTLAWFQITKKMLIDAKATKSDVDGFTDFVRSINGVQVALMIFEQLDGTCRINLRGKGKYSVNGIANTLGGGGHRLAAGAIVNGSLPHVKENVINMAIQSIQEEQSLV